MKKIIFAILASLALLAGCSDGSQAPDSDSGLKYENGSKIPIDDKVYTITGVVAAPKSLTRQVEPAKGSTSGFVAGGVGSVSGSYTGPIEAGKGFVRVGVTQSNASHAAVGTKVILKTTDTKVTALADGDRVTFKCRQQYEAVAAAREAQPFDPATDGTWELDYCRLAEPEFRPSE